MSNEACFCCRVRKNGWVDRYIEILKENARKPGAHHPGTVHVRESLLGYFEERLAYEIQKGMVVLQAYDE